MRRLRLWAATTAVMLASSLAGIPSAPVAQASHTSWCAEGAAPPCVAAATRNGAAVTATNANWDVSVVKSTSEGSTDLLWNVTSKETPNPYVLGEAALDDRWSITFDVGKTIPRVSFVRGADTVMARHRQDDGSYRVTITSTPIVQSGGCDQSVWPWSCPQTATDEWRGYLGGQITDYGVWEDVAQREAMYGMNYATNVDATSLPPEIVHDSATGTEFLLIRLASPHFRADGTTLVRGFAQLRIPNAFLRMAYGVDAPATMTGAGLVPSVSGSEAGSGTITVTQESGDDAMLVDIANVTFSNRIVRIKRGTITPTRPTDMRATRLSAYRGRIGFDAATPRGSRITGYRARCEARQGSDVATATADAAPIIVRELRPTVGYDCRVRALSRAGAGRWSVITILRGQPA